jgi:type IV pilus assembly protein PilX
MLPSSDRRQRGAALVIVLILIVIIALLGVSSMRGTLLEERMSANLYDRSLAFQAAEAALREGEILASTKPAGLNAQVGCANGLCGPRAPNEYPYWVGDADWWETNAREAETGLTNVGGTPRYIVEFIGNRKGCSSGGNEDMGIGAGAGGSCDSSYYRITARSQAENRAAVMLQSIYQVF